MLSFVGDGDIVWKISAFALAVDCDDDVLVEIAIDELTM